MHSPSIVGRLASEADDGRCCTAAASATAYVCDSPDVTSAESSALAVATEIATATATAIAGVFAECTAEGSGVFVVNGRSLAVAEASAIASSFAEATTTASVCGQCETAADAIIESFEAIYITATSLAEVTLEGATTGDRIEASADVFVSTIVTATATAFAKVLPCHATIASGDMQCMVTCKEAAFW